MEDLDSQDYFVVVTLVDENGVFVEKYFKSYIDWEIYRVHYKIILDTVCSVDFVNFENIDNLE